MELDTFLSSPRWDVLRLIAERPSSPMEIAAALGTTISFISQQLKLLEAAGIVVKKRTGNVEKGKPRNMFSLKQEGLYLVPLAAGMAEKKMISLTREKKIVLAIWTKLDVKVQSLVERVFWGIADELDNMQGIFAYTKGVLPKLYILSQNGDVLESQLNKTQEGLEDKIPFQIETSVSVLGKLDSGLLVPLYDPHRLLRENI